ncbi:MAG: hypothetical protein ABR510_01885 [Trueperaceae bacterium]
MCWIPLALGAAMLVGGSVMIVGFYRGHGAQAPEVASPTRVEMLLLGVLMTSIGTLVFILGLTGAICTSLGIA